MDNKQPLRPSIHTSNYFFNIRDICSHMPSAPINPPLVVINDGVNLPLDSVDVRGDGLQVTFVSGIVDSGNSKNRVSLPLQSLDPENLHAILQRIAPLPDGEVSRSDSGFEVVPYGSVRDIWRSPATGEVYAIDPSFYENNGNPCDENGDDMVFSHSEIASHLLNKSVPSQFVNNWDNDAIQFPRLIEEAQAAGAFTKEVVADMAISMDLEPEQVEELMDRATSKWEEIKNSTIAKK